MTDGHKTLLQQRRDLAVNGQKVDALAKLSGCLGETCTSRNSKLDSSDTESDDENTRRPAMTKAKTIQHVVSAPQEKHAIARAVGVFVKTAHDGYDDLAGARVPEPPRGKKVSFSLSSAELDEAVASPSQVFAKTPAWPRRHEFFEDLANQSDDAKGLSDQSSDDENQRPPMAKSVTSPLRTLNQTLLVEKSLTKSRRKQTLEQFLAKRDNELDITCRTFLKTWGGATRAMDIDLSGTVEEVLCFAGLKSFNLRFRGRILHPRMSLKQCGVELGSVLHVEDRSNSDSAFRRRAYCSREQGVAFSLTPRLSQNGSFKIHLSSR